MNEKSPQDPAPETPAPAPNQGADLSLGLALGFLLFLAALTAGTGAWLLTWKHSVDSSAVAHFEQPTWSALGTDLAWLRVETSVQTPGQPVRCQLWAAGRFGDQRRLLAGLPPGRFRVIAWLEEDRRILLEALDPQPEGPLFLDIASDGSGGRQVRFPDRRMRLVGHGDNQLFFERPLAAKDGSSGLELVEWRPSATGFSRLVAIPSPASEPVHIESARVSLDDQRVALVMRGPSQTGPLGIWVFRREQGQLVWTTVSVAGARHLEVAWSPDSGTLVGAAWLGDSSELYLIEDGPDPLPIRMRTASGPLAFTPLWPRDGARVLLQETRRVLDFDLQRHRARVLLSPRDLGLDPDRLVLSPRGSAAAFCTRSERQSGVYVVALNGGHPQPIHRPGEQLQAQATLLYAVAEGLEYAGSWWTGRENSRAQ